jgi:nucleoid-associated protein YgaU
VSDGLPRQAPLRPGEVVPPTAPVLARRQPRTSRHADLATYRRDLDGQEVEVFEPRLPVAPPVRARYTVRPGDRLDLLAARFLGDPHQYWRLADANPAALDALEEPGRDLDVPGGA